MTTLYTSDSHLSHTNIIRYAKRPYRDVAEMNADIVAKLREAEAACDRLVHAGDLCFNLRFFLEQHGPIFASNVGKIFVAGNHDRMAPGPKMDAYASQFDAICGDERTWKEHNYALIDTLDGQWVKVLVSHKPQSVTEGVNVYGHVHNNLLFPGEGHHPEDDWVMASGVHFCACVELHDFRPVSLQQLADAHRSGYPLAAPAVAQHFAIYPPSAVESLSSLSPRGDDQ